ncbi:hypothetical protein ACHAPT_005292 [Fusarium lateritium]
MPTNQQNTGSEKKGDIVPASRGKECTGEEENKKFQEACESMGFLQLSEPALADQAQPKNADIFDHHGEPKNCSQDFLPLLEPARADEIPPKASETTDQDGGLKNCPGNFLPLLEPPRVVKAQPIDKDMFDQHGGLKNYPGALCQPPVHGREENDIFDSQDGLKNCPGAYPVDEPKETFQPEGLFQSNGSLRNCPGAYPASNDQSSSADVSVPYTNKAGGGERHIRWKDMEATKEKQG